MDQHQAAVVSVALGPLIDGPRQELTVVHRSPLVWQLADASSHVVACVTFPGSLRFPHAIALTQRCFETPPLRVGAGQLSWGAERLPIVRWWCPARPDHRSLRLRVRDDVADECVRWWRRSLGRGEGLTPYADDVLCGTLAALHAARHVTANLLSRAVGAAPLEALTTAASAGLLRQAAAGWCLDEVSAVLRAQATGIGLRAAEAALSQVGHSSGRGLMEGITNILQPLSGKVPA